MFCAHNQPEKLALLIKRLLDKDGIFISELITTVFNKNATV